WARRGPSLGRGRSGSVRTKPIPPLGTWSVAPYTAPGGVDLRFVERRPSDGPCSGPRSPLDRSGVPSIPDFRSRRRMTMTTRATNRSGLVQGISWLIAAAGLFLVRPSWSQQEPAQEKSASGETNGQKTSYDQVTPVLLGVDSFPKMMARDKAEKE